MDEIKDRLIAEKNQLDKNVEKLEAFLKSDGFLKISPIQQSLLRIQLNAMLTYAQALIERISWI